MIASHKHSASLHSDSVFKQIATNMAVGNGVSDDETGVEAPARRRFKASVAVRAL